MISQAENERLTRVGAGTPGGNLLRRYWYPVAATEEMLDVRAKRVRLLGEDLVLTRGLRGLGVDDRRVGAEPGGTGEERRHRRRLGALGNRRYQSDAQSNPAHDL